MKISIKEAEKKAQILVNHFKTKNFDFVIANGKKLIKLTPDFFAIYNLIGLSYQRLGKWNEAIRYFEIASQINPKYSAAYNNIGLSYYQLDNFNKAELFYKKNLELNPKDPAALGNLGNLYKDLNKVEEATIHYNDAIKNNPGGIININNLGLLYLSIGKFKEAIVLFKKCLEIDPNFTRADRNISIALKYEIDNPHINEMEQKLVSKNFQEDLKIDLYFALGKAYDDIKNISKAIGKYKSGNKLKRKFIEYNIKDDISLFKNIKDFFLNVDLNSKHNLDKNKKKIIFILGMPRSGTTLVEQIISSHNQVYGGGELKELTQVVKNNFSSDNKIRFIEHDQNIFDKIGNEYLDKLERFNIKENIITDKTPLNFRWIGVIRLIFPNSKIIHCNRNPNDNCISLYKNIFEGSLDWSYDIDEMSKYYKLYADLMEFWNNKTPDYIYNLTYENLISDQKNEINKILKFCNLSFDENCFTFHKNKRQISTASVAQARNPIYKTSLQNWKKYEQWLGPLFDNLK